MPNYTDEAGEFAVAFPIAPKLETATESTQMGPFVRHTAMASVNADHTFAVSWGDLGAEGTPLNIDGMLDGAATAEVSSVGATLVSKKTIKLGTVPGREVTARVILEKACTLRSRIFQSGRRQYQLVTIVPTADATTAVDAFFSSFKFTS